MKKLSRGAWAAIAAVTAIPATVAIAATMERGGGWHKMSPETRARLDEGKIAFAKAALKLTADQEKLWAPIETQVRDAFKQRDTKRAEHEKMRAEREKERAGGKTEKTRPDMAERIEKMSQNMTERADRMKAFAGSFKPFYASLSDEQKEVLRPLVRDLAPGFGKGGHGGKRWAQNGWGPGGREHHGWGGKRHHGERGDRGGPSMNDEGSGGPDGGDAPADKAPEQGPK